MLKYLSINNTFGNSKITFLRALLCDLWLCIIFLGCHNVWYIVYRKLTEPFYFERNKL